MTLTRALMVVPLRFVAVRDLAMYVEETGEDCVASGGRVGRAGVELAEDEGVGEEADVVRWMDPTIWRAHRINVSLQSSVGRQ